MRIIRGKYGRRRFDVPSNIKARPTTDFARENLFNVLDSHLDYEETTALDLFAGTGAISLELLSRGCPRVIGVEKHPTQYNFINKVLQQLGDDNMQIIRGDVFKFVASCGETFDFIFADPPYDLPQLDTIPSKVLDQHCLLRPGGLFVLEHSRNNDFTSHPWFAEHRVYGSVNFTFFIRPEE